MPGNDIRTMEDFENLIHMSTNRIKILYVSIIDAMHLRRSKWDRYCGLDKYVFAGYFSV